MYTFVAPPLPLSLSLTRTAVSQIAEGGGRTPAPPLTPQRGRTRTFAPIDIFPESSGGPDVVYYRASEFRAVSQVCHPCNRALGSGLTASPKQPLPISSRFHGHTPPPLGFVSCLRLLIARSAARSVGPAPAATSARTRSKSPAVSSHFESPDEDQTDLPRLVYAPSPEWHL